MKSFIAGLVLVGAWTANLATAMPLTYSDSRSVAPQDTRMDLPNTVPFSLPKFDPSLGTLTNVTLTVSGSAVSSLVFTNLAPSTGGVRTSQTNTLFVNFNSSPVAQKDFVWTTPDYPINVPVDADGGVYKQSWGSETVDWTKTFTLPSDLAIFTGAGTVPVSARFDVWFDLFATGGNNVAKVSTWSDFKAVVDYQYAPVPEPSSLALLAGGMLLLPAVRRARYRNRREFSRSID